MINILYFIVAVKNEIKNNEPVKLFYFPFATMIRRLIKT